METKRRSVKQVLLLFLVSFDSISLAFEFRWLNGINHNKKTLLLRQNAVLMSMKPAATTDTPSTAIDPNPEHAPFQIVRVTCQSDESLLFRQGVQELFQLYFEELRQVGCDLDFQGFQSEWTDLPGKYDFTKRGGLYVAVDATAATATAAGGDDDDGQATDDIHQSLSSIIQLNQIVGCVALRPLDESDNSCEVKRMYIRESHRRRGIGNLLAKAVMDLAWEQGYDVIKLDSLERLVRVVYLFTYLFVCLFAEDVAAAFFILVDEDVSQIIIIIV